MSNLPVFPPKKSVPGATPASSMPSMPRAQQFSDSRLQQHTDQQAARVSMNQVSRAKRFDDAGMTQTGTKSSTLPWKPAPGSSSLPGGSSGLSSGSGQNRWKK